MLKSLPMTPTPDALSTLRDIHLPHSISQWPLAPGWYLIAVLVISLLATLVFFVRKAYTFARPKREALRLLTNYQNSYESDMNSQVTSAQISLLLKRVALAYFPREKVASLQGDDWIFFLNQTAKKVNFEEVRAELIEMPYQSPKDCDLGLLFEMTRQWIRQRRVLCLS